ncbi:uncharacterized protein LOC131876486 [Cryptomeria japonica]|uniref:uncharacterized protein LOC131876486 n=1 Tax=Cryptomeria japonica TaxID=3369 RepID=UPI0027DA6D3C|nr:uncharacterized protein LOC131876486 [Cryptomeria japonica]
MEIFVVKNDQEEFLQNHLNLPRKEEETEPNKELEAICEFLGIFTPTNFMDEESHKEKWELIQKIIKLEASEENHNSDSDSEEGDPKEPERFKINQIPSNKLEPDCGNESNTKGPGRKSLAELRKKDGEASQGTEGDKAIVKSVEDKDSKNGDPHDRGKEKKWSSLFGVRPLEKSGLPEVKNIFDPMTGVVAISVPDKLVDLTVSGLAMTLVGRFAESIKEEEQRIEANAQKSDSEDQKGGPVSQDKVEESSNDDASASSNTKVNGGDFNEAQDYNISDFEPLLLLTNGSPKPSQCKTPSNSLEMVALEGNLRILSTKEGKSNNGGPNRGKGKRKVEEGGPSKEESTQSKKSISATGMKIQGDKNDSENTEKDSSEMETDKSGGEESWKDEDVGEEEGEAEDVFDQDSPTHSASLGNDNSQPMEEKDDKINEEK